VHVVALFIVADPQASSTHQQLAEMASM